MPNASRRGRATPYTERGIRRVPCARCGEPSHAQWQVCALGNRYMGLCLTCDVAMNATVVRFLRLPDADALIARYRSTRLPIPTGKPSASDLTLPADVSL